MMAQSTMTKEAPPNLSLISSLASLEQFFAELGSPAGDPTNPSELERGRAVSKKPQLEFLTPPEVGPYR